MSRWVLVAVAGLSLLGIACTGGGDPVVQEPPVDVDAPVVLDTSGLVVDGERFAFGVDYAVLAPALEAVLGPPTNDSGEAPTDAGCPTGSPTYRLVDFDGLSLTVLASSAYADGVPHLSQWIAYEEADPAVAVARPDDASVVIEPGTTTVADLRDALGDGVAVEDEPPLGAQFVLDDPGGQLVGALSGVQDEDPVFSVFAGEGCGE